MSVGFHTAVPSAFGNTEGEVEKFTPFTPLKSPPSVIDTEEDCTSFPVVPSKREIALSVAEAGHTTSPVPIPAGRLAVGILPEASRGAYPLAAPLFEVDSLSFNAVCVGVETGKSESAASKAAPEFEVSDNRMRSSAAGVPFGISVGKITSLMAVSLGRYRSWSPVRCRKRASAYYYDDSSPEYVRNVVSGDGFQIRSSEPSVVPGRRSWSTLVPVRHGVLVMVGLYPFTTFFKKSIERY